jgi:hypothetical protein
MRSPNKVGKLLSSQETVPLVEFRISSVEVKRYSSSLKVELYNSLLFCCKLLVSFHVLMHRLKEVSKIYSASS